MQPFVGRVGGSQVLRSQEVCPPRCRVDSPVKEEVAVEEEEVEEAPWRRRRSLSSADSSDCVITPFLTPCYHRLITL